MPEATAGALGQSPTLLETLLETAPLGLGVLDRELRFVRVNDALARGNGVSAEEHLGRRIDDIWPGAPLPLLTGLQRILDGGEAVVDYEIAGERDGRPRYVLGSYYPVRNGDEVVGIGIVVTDTTERKVAEDALRSSERRLSDVLENVHLVAVSMDLDGRITFCNPYHAALTGWRRDELIGRDWYETFTPPERASLREWFLPRLAADDIPAHSESAIRTRSGERRVISWNNTVIRDRRGRPVGATSIGEDVTERRRAERELRSLAAEQAALRRVATVVASEPSEERLLEAVTTEIGLLFGAQVANMTRHEGDHVRVMGGWSEAGARPIPAGTVASFEDLGDTATARVLRTGCAARVDSFDDLRDEGTRAIWREFGYCSAIAAPIVVNGTLWGAISASRTTDDCFAAGAEDRLAAFAELAAQAVANAQAREELRASRARIVEAADDARRRLERNLHDGAQQRLVSISLSLRLAQARLTTDTQAAAEILRGASSELARALEELRELARGLHPAVLSERGLGPALQGLVDRAPLPVELVVPDERWPDTVEAAAYYVVAETLTNVAKYAGATAAWVTVTRTEGTAVIEVVDDGVGGADPHRGSGLRGLADRVEALGGRLLVTSPPGGGTSVRAEIPFG